MCVLMETEGARCTFEDAEMLARYEGIVLGTNAFNSFVMRAMVA
jgi:hypothetical protein